MPGPRQRAGGQRRKFPAWHVVEAAGQITMLRPVRRGLGRISQPAGLAGLGVPGARSRDGGSQDCGAQRSGAMGSGWAGRLPPPPP